MRTLFTTPRTTCGDLSRPTRLTIHYYYWLYARSKFFTRGPHLMGIKIRISAPKVNFLRFSLCIQRSLGIRYKSETHSGANDPKRNTTIICIRGCCSHRIAEAVFLAQRFHPPALRYDLIPKHHPFIVTDSGGHGRGGNIPRLKTFSSEQRSGIAVGNILLKFY